MTTTHYFDYFNMFVAFLSLILLSTIVCEFAHPIYAIQQPLTTSTLQLPDL